MEYGVVLCILYQYPRDCILIRVQYQSQENGIGMVCVILPYV